MVISWRSPWSRRILVAFVSTLARCIVPNVGIGRISRFAVWCPVFGLDSATIAANCLWNFRVSEARPDQSDRESCSIRPDSAPARTLILAFGRLRDRHSAGPLADARQRRSAAAGRRRQRQGPARRERDRAVVSGLGHQADDHLRDAAGGQGRAHHARHAAHRVAQRGGAAARQDGLPRRHHRSPSTTRSRC